MFGNFATETFSRDEVVEKVIRLFYKLFFFKNKYTVSVSSQGDNNKGNSLSILRHVPIN